jgi:t-SNARE complex subunit (syntaxin)
MRKNIPFMIEFLDNSKLILASIKELRKIIEEMKEYIRMKHTSVLSEDKEEALDKKIDLLDNKFYKICEVVRDAIKTTKEETARLYKDGEITKEEEKMRKVHAYKYYKELSDAIYAHRNLKTEYKTKEKDLLKKTYQIVNPKATEAELDKIMESADSEGVMGIAFSTGTQSGQQMLKQAKYRRKRIDDIVENIKKLIALIEEIDELVHKESKTIDDIVVNVTAAEMNTKQANKELESALVYQRKLNFLKRIGVVILILFFVLVLLFFAARNRPQNVYIKQ